MSEPVYRSTIYAIAEELQITPHLVAHVIETFEKKESIKSLEKREAEEAAQKTRDAEWYRAQMADIEDARNWRLRSIQHMETMEESNRQLVDSLHKLATR